MRKIRLAVLIVSGIFLFQYCGYEEGPFISFRSKTNRLKGKWLQTSPLPEDFTTHTRDSMMIEFKDDWNFKSSMDYIKKVPSTVITRYSADGIWEFFEGKKRIKLNWVNNDNGFVIIWYAPNQLDGWDKVPEYQANLTLFRLTNSELWFKWHGENVMYKYQKIEND